MYFFVYTHFCSICIEFPIISPIHFHPRRPTMAIPPWHLRTGPRGGRRIATGATRRGRPPKRDGWRKSMVNDKCIHPGKLTWNPTMKVWKMIFPFNWVNFRFRVNFQGCRCNFSCITKKHHLYHKYTYINHELIITYVRILIYMPVYI